MLDNNIGIIAIMTITIVTAVLAAVVIWKSYKEKTAIGTALLVQLTYQEAFIYAILALAIGYAEASNVASLHTDDDFPFYARLTFHLSVVFINWYTILVVIPKWSDYFRIIIPKLAFWDKKGREEHFKLLALNNITRGRTIGIGAQAAFMTFTALCLPLLNLFMVALGLDCVLIMKLAVYDILSIIPLLGPDSVAERIASSEGISIAALGPNTYLAGTGLEKAPIGYDVYKDLPYRIYLMLACVALMVILSIYKAWDMINTRSFKSRIFLQEVKAPADKNKSKGNERATSRELRKQLLWYGYSDNNEITKKVNKALGIINAITDEEAKSTLVAEINAINIAYNNLDKTDSSAIAAWNTDVQVLWQGQTTSHKGFGMSLKNM